MARGPTCAGNRLWPRGRSGDRGRRCADRCLAVSSPWHPSWVWHCRRNPLVNDRRCSPAARREARPRTRTLVVRAGRLPRDAAVPESVCPALVRVRPRLWHLPLIGLGRRDRRPCCRPSSGLLLCAKHIGNDPCRARRCYPHRPSALCRCGDCCFLALARLRTGQKRFTKTAMNVARERQEDIPNGTIVSVKQVRQGPDRPARKRTRCLREQRVCDFQPFHGVMIA